MRGVIPCLLWLTWTGVEAQVLPTCLWSHHGYGAAPKESVPQKLYLTHSPWYCAHDLLQKFGLCRCELKFTWGEESVDDGLMRTSRLWKWKDVTDPEPDCLRLSLAPLIAI